MKKVIFLVIFLFIFSLPFMFAEPALATYNCQYHDYQACSGGNLYWFDSCDNQQDIVQYCQYGCYNDECQNYNYNYNYNYSSCTDRAYRLCSGNSVYWYSSCGAQQDLYQNCSNSNMVCQYGQCIYYQPIINPVPAPQPVYNPYYTKKCAGSNFYWYDSLGVKSGLYKSCSDANSCTADSCATGACSNTLACDGSTCSPGSADFRKYCGEPQGQDQDQNTTANNLLVSFFASKDPASGQWQKNIQAGSNSTVYFMVSAANNGATPFNNVKISANIPLEIASLGNVELNGTQVSGDIVSGIDIGALTPGSAKSITFEGKTENISSESLKQAAATATVSGVMKTDSIEMKLVPGSQQNAAVTGATAGSAITNFLKRWYLWILVGAVLVFLFVVVFRRLSSAG